MIDEKQKKMIEEYAQTIARNLILYGVDMRDKYDSAVSMSLALESAYLRGRSDGLKYAYEKTKKVGEWIPCSERLPKMGQDVIVTDMITGEVTIAYLNTLNCFVFEDGRCHGASAWMPLPEPYKGVEE